MAEWKIQRFFGDDMFNQRIQPNKGPAAAVSSSAKMVISLPTNHVISDGGDGVADEIMVTFIIKNLTYKTRVIGKDPSSDLAVLK